MLLSVPFNVHEYELARLFFLLNKTQNYPTICMVNGLGEGNELLPILVIRSLRSLGERERVISPRRVQLSFQSEEIKPMFSHSD